MAQLPAREAAIAWALRVVRGEMIELKDLEHPEWVRHCLYVSVVGGSDEWIMREGVVGDWRDE